MTEYRSSDARGMRSRALIFNYSLFYHDVLHVITFPSCSTFCAAQIACSRGVSGDGAMLIMLIAVLCFQSFFDTGSSDDR